MNLSNSDSLLLEQDLIEKKSLVLDKQTDISGNHPIASVLQPSNILVEVSARNMSNEILGKYERKDQSHENHCFKELDRELKNRTLKLESLQQERCFGPRSCFLKVDDRLSRDVYEHYTRTSSWGL